VCVDSSERRRKPRYSVQSMKGLMATMHLIILEPEYFKAWELLESTDFIDASVGHVHFCRVLEILQCTGS